MYFFASNIYYLVIYHHFRCFFSSPLSLVTEKHSLSSSFELLYLDLGNQLYYKPRILPPDQIVLKKILSDLKQESIFS